MCIRVHTKLKKVVYFWDECKPLNNKYSSINVQNVFADIKSILGTFDRRIGKLNARQRIQNAIQKFGRNV